MRTYFTLAERSARQNSLVLFILEYTAEYDRERQNNRPTIRCDRS